MRHVMSLLVLALASVVTTGCQTYSPPPKSPEVSDPLTSSSTVVAYVDGDSISAEELRQLFLEKSGGLILAEVVLDRRLKRRLAQSSLVVGSAEVTAEKKLLLETLDSTDEDQAVRLMAQLRRVRGLGKKRFAAMLHRNAALRLLVQPQVRVSDAAMGLHYQRLYGPRYQGRILVRPTLRDLDPIQDRLTAGESFSDLAAELSSDLSAAQGGLLSPISPVDPEYPQSIRKLLPRLEVGEISDAIAVDGGFALVKLERKIAGQGIEFDDVKEELKLQVTRYVEGMLMDQMARALTTKTGVVVLDPALGQSWQRQKVRLEQGQPPQ